MNIHGEEVDPCGSCGEAERLSMWTPRVDGVIHGQVQCMACGACGPSVPKSEAVARWNRMWKRPEPKPEFRRATRLLAGDLKKLVGGYPSGRKVWFAVKDRNEFGEVVTEKSWFLAGFIQSFIEEVGKEVETR